MRKNSHCDEQAQSQQATTNAQSLCTSLAAEQLPLLTHSHMVFYRGHAFEYACFGKAVRPEQTGQTTDLLASTSILSQCSILRGESMTPLLVPREAPSGEPAKRGSEGQTGTFNKTIPDPSS